MFDATHYSHDRTWPDDSVLAHTEFETGFLLPQLMGALASESGFYELTGKPARRDYGAFLVTLCTTFTRALKLR